MDFSPLQLMQQQLPNQQQHLPSPWANNTQQASHPSDQQLSSAMQGERKNAIIHTLQAIYTGFDEQSCP
jgi:hypothetical protein